MSYITTIFLISLAAAALIYELVVLFMGKKSALISPVVFKAAQKYPFLPFGAGFVAGHLLWPQ